MFADQIEKMKRQYTDKYVLVDATRPELARFRDVVGRVKTVNMSGRALVEFDDYHLNIGWYDIDPEFLKVVDQPPPKAPKPEAKKPAAKAAPAAKTPAPKAPAEKAGRPSVADMLAAARGGKATAPAKAPAEKAPTPAKPQAAAPAKESKVERSKMSVADMLAAARAGGAGTEPAPAKTPAEEPPAQQESPSEVPVAVAPPTGEPASEGGETITRVDKSSMSIDDILAYCRQHDAK